MGEVELQEGLTIHEALYLAPMIQLGAPKNVFTLSFKIKIKKQTKK